MPLGKHTHNPSSGRIRKERSDVLAGTLAQDYPEFKNLNPRIKLGTLEKKFGVESLGQVRKVLRKQGR